MSYTLREIKLGEHDAKREVIKLKNFEEYFYDHNEISERIMDPIIFTVLGKKGTGKTLLAELIKKNSLKDPMWFSKSDSYKTFSLTELQNLKNGNNSVEEYMPIWKWIILIELAKLCIKNEALSYEKEFVLINDFLKENGFSEELESFKTVDITHTKNLSANWKGLKAGKDQQISLEKTSYLELINPLEQILINLLSGQPHKYTILFDELDDKFDGSSNYINSIICLLKVAEELNFKFLEKGIDFKVLIFIRRDILKTLSYSDLNKIIEGSSISLDWGKTENINSPILQLVTNKVKKSIPELSHLSHFEIIKQLFSGNKISVSKNVKVAPDRYVLQRTMLRPRDIVNFLNKIILKYGNHQRITNKMILDVEKNYSEYLKNEIRDELVGQVDHIAINDFFKLLKNFGNTEFKYTDLSKYYESHLSSYSKFELDKVINAFYRAGALGSKRYNPMKNTNYYSWSYKEDDDTIDLDNIICIHNGLRKSLNLH